MQRLNRAVKGPNRPPHLGDAFSEVDPLAIERAPVTPRHIQAKPEAISLRFNLRVFHMILAIETYYILLF